MKRIIILSIFNIFIFTNLLAQDYNLGVIAFYNLENLFDTEDDPKIRDEEFLPTGGKQWSQERYQIKLNNMAKVISQLGGENGPAVLGVCEVENRKVLEDLTKTDLLKKHNYQIVHEDSPDHRGIDVGLLYQPSYFKPFSYKSRALKVAEIPNMVTRDQLVVSGVFDTDTLHFIINHWPSRRGGEKRSEPRRVAAAKLCKNIVDSLGKLYTNPKVLIMGDFNDDPANNSIKKALGAKGDIDKVKQRDLFNPMFKLHKKGLGTLAYRDRWQIFDQIIITGSLAQKNEEGYFFRPKSARVFKEDWMQQQEGRYKGYPLRTYVGSSFKGGYSDHFPVYLHILRKNK